MEKLTNLVGLLEKLTGQKPEVNIDSLGIDKSIFNESKTKINLGYSQFNEILLLLGYDRISKSFFQYLVDSELSYKEGASIDSWEQLISGIDNFRRSAMLTFGNIKYAFKYLSTLSSTALKENISIKEISDDYYSNRHFPLLPINPITSNSTFYLGYIIGDEIKKTLEENPHDSVALEEEKKRIEIVDQGKKNQLSYLTSDHMDIYVATSMRERHEFAIVNDVLKQIFEQEKLKNLKLRYFDPTQAYCNDRIDKGLSEALMLKRAACTLYLAQESDTLGKDSELASTLAQGKPVIAYVPEINNEYLDKYINLIKELNPKQIESKIIIEQLRLFDPGLAWDSANDVHKWLSSPDVFDIEKGKKLLLSKMENLYNKRAKTLKETHPLGIQVNLDTGVANGVLVVRSVQQCVDLIYNIMTNKLEFSIEEKKVDDKIYIFLKEKISDSIFRVVTGDDFLTNIFWNFYLKNI